MEQKELYELAGKLDSKEIAYLIASHLEHIGKKEFGFTINANGGFIFEGSCKCYYPHEYRLKTQ